MNHYSLAKKLTHNNIVFYVVLFAICSLIYNDVFSLKYIWDDHYILFENSGLTSKIFSHGLITAWTGTFFSKNLFYRPIVFTSYFLEFYFFGANPAYAHAINLLLLMINSILVYKTSLLLLNDLEPKKSNLRAKLVTMVYATSPILVESTVWISGRFDLLCTTFMLLAIINYVNLRLYYYKLVVVSFFCLCAVLCKEEAIILPCILYVMEFYFDIKYHKTDNYNNKLKILFWIIILFVTYVIYIELKINMLLIGKSIHYKIDNAPCLDSWHCKIIADKTVQLVHLNMDLTNNLFLTNKFINTMVVWLNFIFSTFNEYVRTLLFPFFYACTEHTNIINITVIDTHANNKVLLYVIINMFTQIIIGLYLFSITRKKNKRVFLLIIMYLISMSLVVNIIPIPEMLNVQDRFLTFPLVFALVAIFRAKYNSTHLFFLNTIKFLICIFIVIDCIVVYHHVPDFKTDVIFWTKRAKAEPTSTILLMQKRHVFALLTQKEREQESQ